MLNELQVIALCLFLNDFCKVVNESIIAKTKEKRRVTRKSRKDEAEIMTILLLWNQSSCINFKKFYTEYLDILYPNLFVKLSYGRFIENKKKALIYLDYLLKFFMLNLEQTGIYYIDSTSLKVCKSKRISSHKTFKGISKTGKTSIGWFHGFKLRMVINQKGEIMNIAFTSGNINDRAPLKNILNHLKGLVFGDKGYLGNDLFQDFFCNNNIKIITPIKKGMKNILIDAMEKALLRKRSVIESVFNILKTHLGIEHSRHRSPINFIIHLLSTLIAYFLIPQKSSITMPLQPLS